MRNVKGRGRGGVGLCCRIFGNRTSYNYFCRIARFGRKSHNCMVSSPGRNCRRTRPSACPRRLLPESLPTTPEEPPIEDQNKIVSEGNKGRRCYRHTMAGRKSHAVINIVWLSESYCHRTVSLYPKLLLATKQFRGRRR